MDDPARARILSHTARSSTRAQALFDYFARYGFPWSGVSPPTTPERFTVQAIANGSACSKPRQHGADRLDDD